MFKFISFIQCHCYLSGVSRIVRKHVNWETTRHFMLWSLHLSLSRFPISACTCTKHTRQTNVRQRWPILSYCTHKLASLSFNAVYLWARPPILCAALNVFFLHWNLHKFLSFNLTATQRTTCFLLCPKWRGDFGFSSKYIKSKWLNAERTCQLKAHHFSVDDFGNTGPAVDVGTVCNDGQTDRIQTNGALFIGAAG